MESSTVPSARPDIDNNNDNYNDTEEQTVRSLLVAPTRPGAVVTTALERGLPIA